MLTHRTAEVPPQAVLTQRTAEVPPQAVPMRCATLALGCGGRWQPLWCVDPGRHTEGLACHGGPRVSPHTLASCRSTPYRGCRGRRSPRGQDQRAHRANGGAVLARTQRS